MTKFRILMTTDLQGRLAEPQTNLGLAYLAESISLLRDENTLVLDNGNSLYGSSLSYYHHRFHPAELSLMTQAMKLVGYDFVNVGIEDFQQGCIPLRRHLQGLGIPCLCNNVSIDHHPLGQTYTIKELPNGLRIALFGLCNTQPLTLPEADHIQILSAYESAKATVSLIQKKENVDYIVGLYQGSFEKDFETGEVRQPLRPYDEAYRICHEIEGLDILLTGHEQQSLLGNLDGVAVTQTKGTEMVCVDVEQTLVNEEFNDDIGLHIVLPEDQPNHVLQEATQETVASCAWWLQETVGSFHAQEEVESCYPTNNLINSLQKRIGQSDLSLTLDQENTILPFGPVTPQVILSTFSSSNSLVVLEVSGTVIRSLVERSLSLMEKQEDELLIASKPGFVLFDGFEVFANLHRPRGKRILQITRGSNPLLQEETYTCTCTQETAQRLPELRDIPPLRRIEKDTVTLILEEFEQKKEIQIPFQSPYHIQ